VVGFSKSHPFGVVAAGVAPGRVDGNGLARLGSPIATGRKTSIRVKAVRAALERDRDDAAAEAAVFGREGLREHAKLANRVDRGRDDRLVAPAIDDRDAVDEVVDVVRARAVDVEGVWRRPPPTRPPARAARARGSCGRRAVGRGARAS
jgi:hypothetical protein